MAIALENVRNATTRKMVRLYLAQRNTANTLKGQVGAVYEVILGELEPRTDDGELITDSERLYLCSDDALCTRIYAEGNTRLRALGIKPDHLGDEYCPALVAGHELISMENALLDEGFRSSNLTCDNFHGDDRAKALELLVGVNR